MNNKTDCFTAAYGLNHSKAAVKYPSPCVRKCCLDEHDICVGCLRSMQEIMQWANATDAQKEQILYQVKLRKKT